MNQCNLRYEFSNKRSTSKSTEENQVSSPPQNAPRFEICGAKRPIPAPAVYRPGNISATDTSFRSRRDSAFSRGSAPRQRPNDDARNDGWPAPFLRTTHCWHIVSNCLPAYKSTSPIGKRARIFRQSEKRVDDAGKLREVLQRAALLCREAQRWLVFGESVDKRGFSRTATAIDHRHPKAAFHIHAIKLARRPLTTNEHICRPSTYD